MKMGLSGQRSAGYGRQHRHRVAVGNRGLEPAEEPDVLIIEVHVDEPAELLAVDEAFAQAAVRGVQVDQQLAQRGAGPLHRLRAAGVAAQDGRDANLNGHETTLLGELLYAMGGNRAGWQLIPAGRGPAGAAGLFRDLDGFLRHYTIGYAVRTELGFRLIPRRY